MEASFTPAPLPTNVDSTEHLEAVPDEYLSGDFHRPLLHTDAYCGSKYKYALKPLFYSAIFILLIELLERFSYYGIVNTQTPYLVGQYNPSWNANMTGVEASSYVSGSTAIAYSVPFLGGIIADAFLGDYFTIIVGTLVFYIPGLLLLALTTIPYLLGSTFSRGALTAGMLVLYPVGAGLIKSVVNVMGAKQYHPFLQSDQIQSYYVNFYLSINVGSLVGGILIPLLAQIDVTVAYMIPVGALALGLVLFLLGSRRYVRVTPRKDVIFKTLRIVGSTVMLKPFEKIKQSNGGSVDDGFVDGFKQLLAIIPISALTIPFNIAYAQMITVFSLQGMAMNSAGFIDSSMMLNFDPLAVLFFGFLIGSFLYPHLARRGVRIAITHKFAMGTAFGALAVLASIIVDYQIHKALEAGHQISILWQVFNYVFIGAGEIFAVASAYEAAYVIAPKDQKGFSSALNLFLVGAVPNFISISLYNACSMWFPVDGSDAAYEQSRVYNYLWVLFGISVGGVLLNLFPPIKNWVEHVHDRAIALSAEDANKAAAHSSSPPSSSVSAASAKEDVEEPEQTKTSDSELDELSFDEFTLDDVDLKDA
jgi:dipeptide/tripeptide permease